MVQAGGSGIVRCSSRVSDCILCGRCAVILSPEVAAAHLTEGKSIALVSNNRISGAVHKKSRQLVIALDCVICGRTSLNSACRKPLIHPPRSDPRRNGSHEG